MGWLEIPFLSSLRGKQGDVLTTAPLCHPTLLPTLPDPFMGHSVPTAGGSAHHGPASG